MAQALLVLPGSWCCFWKPITNPLEQRNSQTEREALALVWALEHFNFYVSGVPFRVITYQQPMQWIWKKSQPSPSPGPLVYIYNLMHWSSSTVQEKLTPLITYQDTQWAQRNSRAGNKKWRAHMSTPKTTHQSQLLSLYLAEGSYSERQNTPNSDWHFRIRPIARDKQLPKPGVNYDTLQSHRIPPQQSMVSRYWRSGESH